MFLTMNNTLGKQIIHYLHVSSTQISSYFFLYLKRIRKIKLKTALFMRFWWKLIVNFVHSNTAYRMHVP